MLIELLFPTKCINCKRFGELVCANCFAMISYNSSFVCAGCLTSSLNGITHVSCTREDLIDGVIPVVANKGVARKLLSQLKGPPFIKAISNEIASVMVEGLIQNESFYAVLSDTKPCVVPIPLSEAGMRYIGYNPAETIGSYVAQYFKLELSKSLKRSIKDIGTPHSHKNKHSSSMKDTFKFNKNSLIPECVILVDDAAKDFALLNEAAKILKRNGVKKVIGITFVKDS